MHAINRCGQNSQLDANVFDVMLNLTLAVVDYSQDDPSYRSPTDPTIYDADDEDQDDTYIFPCHVTFDDCHPDLLVDYHRNHLRNLRTSIQIVKHPKLCEFVVDYMFKILRDHMNTTPGDGLIPQAASMSASFDLRLSETLCKTSGAEFRRDYERAKSLIDSRAQDAKINSSFNPGEETNVEFTLTKYLDSVILLIKRLNKVCIRERKNCRILGRTDTLEILLKNTLYLLQVAPDRQHIYLEPMLRLILTLADYRITGKQLKLLFEIVKDENAELKVILKCMERLLCHHHRILRNIQPLKSINFPTASRTAEEIEYDPYISNSWHWRLRSKVIEFKRKRSRSVDMQPVDLKAAKNPSSSQQQDQDQQKTKPSEGLADRSKVKVQKFATDSSKEESNVGINVANTNTSNSNSNKVTPSWLECSIMTPLSNISPLIHNGEIKFCCSMWLSICGDLLVTDELSKTSKERKLDDDGLRVDWNSMQGHWLRLTSRRRLARRYRESFGAQRKRTGAPNKRTRRLSAKIRRRQAHDKEDEEHEELAERVRKSEPELNQTFSGFGRLRMRFMQSSTSQMRLNSSFQPKITRSPGNTSLFGRQTSMPTPNTLNDPKRRPPREFLGRRARDNSQELLMHLISFAIDTLTIEIWLNVKCMTFCARACRIAREGQTNVLDQVTFASHLKADGSWSHLVFCLAEVDKGSASSGEKMMNLKLVVNGIHKEKEKLVYANSKSPMTNFACLLGCERSTFGYVWKLSQVHIYKNIPDKNLPLYLLGKGPDFWTFTNFRQQQSTLPLPDIGQRSIRNLLNPKLLNRYSDIDEERALNWLTQNVVIVFVAHQPEYFLDYSSSMIPASSSLINSHQSIDQQFSNSAERFIQAKTLDFARALKFSTNDGFGSALVEAGGIESVLMAFADVVRRTENAPQTHSLAFSILLQMSQTNQHHLNKFLDELNGLKLTEFILTHPNCIVSKQMLECYLDLCLMRSGDHCLIRSSRLIYHLMSSWRAWHKDLRVARLFYRRLIRLLQPTSTGTGRRLQPDECHLESVYIDYNFRMLTNAGGIDILMSILRECLVPLDESVPSINHELVVMIVNLISLLIKHPPGLNVMLDIMEFLLFLHPDHKAYVETASDRSSFLHPLQGGEEEMIVYEDGAASRVRTPESETSVSSEAEATHAHGATTFGGSGVTSDQTLDSMLSGERETSPLDVNGHALFNTNRISEERELNKLADFISSYIDKRSESRQANEARSETNQTADARQSKTREMQQQLADPQDKSSTRNFAIANIADMLASMVKLTSSDPMNLLSEALGKPIIDVRKLIILANNDSALVREKVLRLFLYCIRACYTLNLKNILNKYEQDSKTSSTFKSCIPIQLMARQLLKYPTTMKMIQLCYGIIVDIDDFETVETVCLTFDIETFDNNLQVNILILLIQLMTQLQDPKDIESAVRFVHAFIKQLLQHGEKETVAIIFKSTLVDSLMQLYFRYVESEVTRLRDIDNNDAQYPQGAEEPLVGGECGELSSVKRELDRTQVLVVRHYIQNLPTSEAIKSIEDLLLYFDLMNTHVSPKYHHLLRDQKVKVLLTALKYCRLYEQCARRKSCGGKVEYYLRSLFKDNELNSFENVLPDHQLADLFDYKCGNSVLSCASDSSICENEEEDNKSINCNNGSNLNHSRISGQNSSTIGSNGSSNYSSESTDKMVQEDTSSQNGFHVQLEDDENRDPASNNEFRSNSTGQTTEKDYFDGKNINENDVIERFKAIFEFIADFITTREPGVIPSPMERNFIMKCIKMLARYLDESKLLSSKQARSDSKNKCQWSLMLPKLERLFRDIFSRLILYLLSPCDSMNLDERKYYALTLLERFEVMELIQLLGDDADKISYKILLIFIKDLIEFNKTAFNSDDSTSDHDDETLADDTEGKLRYLAKNLEFQLGYIQELKQSNGSMIQADVPRKKTKGPKMNDNRMDTKFRDVWLADLNQRRDEAREKIDVIKAGNKSLNGSPMDNSSEECDRVLDEALNITKDVVNDKHEQRKAYLDDLKQNKVYNYHIRQQWLSLIIGHTHERAIWYLEDHYPKSLELNPVEGPSRIRRRLRPCKLSLDSKFLRDPNKRCYGNRARSFSAPGYQTTDGSTSSLQEATRKSRGLTQEAPLNNSKNELISDDWYNQYSPHPLCSMFINQERSMDSTELRIRMFTTDKIHFNCDCSIVRPNEVCEGEVSIASWCIHFIGERSDNYQQHLNESQLLNRRQYLRKQKLNAITKGERQGVSTSGEDDEVDRSMYESSKLANVVQRHRSQFTSTIVEDLWFDEIVEIWDRRYQLQDVGLEIFLTNNMTYLFSFRCNRDREDFKYNLMREQHKMINLQRFNLNTSLNRLTQLWRDGRLTNFDYLTCLNKLAGRSFNDLMQYPVFPFVLSNYTSDTLDLNLGANYRKLDRPMAIQNEEKETNFKNNYQASQTTSLSVGPCGLTKPYHYSNHYSNSATVLHFLVRLPPFTQMLIQYQDNNFDQPDRTFHSIASTWQLITRDSNTDFKELIPEFFFLPEMFVNFEQFELGRKQSNELVDDVKLPPWCPNADARLFTLIHRQALESSYVSENLHHWIDLIFGYKQVGKAAVEALNVFHPATYYGEIDLNGQFQPAPSTIASSLSARSSAYNSDYMSSTLAATSSEVPQPTLPGQHSTGSDAGSLKRALMNVHQHKRLQADIERSALETMIKTYGQMPRQLFTQPMKQRSFATFTPQVVALQHQREPNFDGTPYKRIEPLRQVRGLRWGSFVGSPDDPDIIAVKHKKINPEDQTSIQKARRSLKYQPFQRPVEKYQLHLLPNGEIAIMRSNTSLMLDYRADRKSGSSYQLSLPSTRYSRRAGLSSVARMNLFSNMIISRQQFSFIEPSYLTSNQYDSFSSTSSSSLVSITAPRVKFSPESLSMVSWFYLDGTIRIRYPAMNNQKPSVPLVQANTIVDSMSTCCSIPELNLLLVGYNSGSICAHIVSTSYETAPVAQYTPTNASSAALSSNSAAPSAVHFLHTTSGPSSSMSAANSALGPGKVTEKSLTGEPYTALALAGKTLQSVRSINKTTRWLYCHSKRVNCIKINISFGIVVTGSDDGTSVIWDLNSLTYVRTIDYRLESFSKKFQTTSDYYQATAGAGDKTGERLSQRQSPVNMQRLLDYLCSCDRVKFPDIQMRNLTPDPEDHDEFGNSCGAREIDDKCRSCECSICSSGISLIAISDTLGDIVTVKDINNRLAATTDLEEEELADVSTEDHLKGHGGPASSANSKTGANFASASSLDTSQSENSVSSVVYVHTINGSLVGFVNCHTQVTAVCYSHAPEGVSVNVIVIGLADGSVRLYSSWDLSRVKEFRLSNLTSPISSLMYSRDNQLLYVAYTDSQLVVLRNKKKGSVSLPKEWFL